MALTVVLVDAILQDNTAVLGAVLADSPNALTDRAGEDVYLERIAHYMYRGDTALHLAAAAYRTDIALYLVEHGADVHARNRRGAEPLHYAADGSPGAATWKPAMQARTIAVLLKAGADPNATDNSGVAPLHRAVRTRCAAAVRALLAGGADPLLANRNGSTPMDLARRTTGRGGSGSPEAREQQAEIVEALRHYIPSADGRDRM